MSKGRQREIKQEWVDFTGWEFMGPRPGENFYEALQRNKKWLNDHALDADNIGHDILNPRWG